MRTAIVALAALLTACSPGRAWKDTTGQNRGFNAMRADELGCIKEVDDWQKRTGIELYPIGVVNRRALCMAEHGWAQNL
ncbi:MAG: hypothetical protein BGO00_02730 [Alphaproteobacteria bacterium 62-8]|nr:MAG: hypothetical protein BGO00_02730 [Alphaproteobacteria bacterium 62-8]